MSVPQFVSGVVGPTILYAGDLTIFFDQFLHGRAHHDAGRGQFANLRREEVEELRLRHHHDIRALRFEPPEVAEQQGTAGVVIRNWPIVPCGISCRRSARLSESSNSKVEG